MTGVVNGRYTAKMDEPFVVFIIRMRINKPFAVRKWVPTVLEGPHADCRARAKTRPQEGARL